MGAYYGAGWTNNEAEVFATRDCMAILAELSKQKLQLLLPIWVFGDNQLIVGFLYYRVRNCAKHLIYWALHEIWELKKHLKGPIAYRNISRKLNMVADNIYDQALKAKGTVAFHSGETLPQARSN